MQHGTINGLVLFCRQIARNHQYTSVVLSTSSTEPSLYWCCFVDNQHGTINELVLFCRQAAREPVGVKYNIRHSVTRLVYSLIMHSVKLTITILPSIPGYHEHQIPESGPRCSKFKLREVECFDRNYLNNNK